MSGMKTILPDPYTVGRGRFVCDEQTVLRAMEEVKKKPEGPDRDEEIAFLERKLRKLRDAS